MPISREQLETLQKLAAQAAEVLNGVDDAACPDSAIRERLQAVMAYARLVLESADAMLVPDAVNDLAAAFQEWIDGTDAIIATPDGWIERILAGLSRLPAAQGRNLEQAVKDAAATFQRSAQQRLAALNGEVDTARNEVKELLSELAIRRAEIDAVVKEARQQQDEAVAERLAHIDARTQEISDRVEQEVQRIDSLVVEQTESSERFRTNVPRNIASARRSTKAGSTTSNEHLASVPTP